MGAPLLRGPRLSLLLLLLQPHQHHCRRRFLLHLPVQGLLPLLPLPPSSCRLNHRPPPAPRPSVPIGISTISSDPQPSSSGVLGEPPAKKIRVRPRQAYQDKVADIRSATRCYPSDADSLHNTGIPPQYAVRRAGASGRGTSLYDCPYSDLCSTPPYVGDFPSCGSHV